MDIIFWFSRENIKRYWFGYTLEYCLKKIHNNAISYSKIKDKIQLGNLNILFKVDRGENSPERIGIGNINQYWVEELFDNDFEEFFKEIIKKEIGYEKEIKNR